MICALTVRRLKPGAFDQFREAFMRGASGDRMPDRMRRFHMIRSMGDPDEVITFGLYDGTVDELRAEAAAGGYSEQMDAIAPFVESVGIDGFFQVVEEIER